MKHLELLEFAGKLIEENTNLRTEIEKLKKPKHPDYTLVGTVAGGAGLRTIMHPSVSYILPIGLQLYARISEPTGVIERYTTEDDK